MTCPFCGKDVKYFNRGWTSHSCNETIDIHHEKYKFVLCPMKRFENARKLVKKGIFLINGIGDTKKILTDIYEECLNCEHQGMVEDDGYECQSFPYWRCEFLFHTKGYSHLNLILMNKGGHSILDYIDSIDKNIRLISGWENHVFTKSLLRKNIRKYLIDYDKYLGVKQI